MSGKIKKSLSKFLSVTVCAGLVFSAVPVFAGDGVEDTTPVNLFEEDFESYSTDAAVKGKGHFLTETWRASEDTSFGYDSGGQAKIALDPTNPDNKVLALEGRSAYNAAAAPVMENTDLMNLDPLKTYKLEFDMYTPNKTVTGDPGARAGGGIRFMNGGGNYYQIYWLGGNRWTDGTKSIAVSKSSPNNRFDTSAVTTKSGVYPSGAFPAAKWHHMTVIFANGEASWSAVNKETGVENADFSGSFLQPANIVDNGDGTVTVTEQKIPVSGDVALKFMASGQGTEYTLFDNIVLNEYNPWFDGKTEADNILYYNASDIMRVNDGVYDILNASKIRRITSDTVSSFTMSISEDGETYTDVEVTLDSGKWINTVSEAKTRYIKFSDESVADNINIYCEVEGGESFDVSVGKSLNLVLREKGKDVGEPHIVVSDSYRLSPAVSAITALRDGNVSATVYGTGVAKNFSINIIGEMKDAEINGTEDAYIAEKAPIIDAISDATDKQIIYDIMKGTGETKLSDIKDFDMDAINALSDDELNHVAQALIDYTFDIKKIDDVRDFMQTITDEIKLLEVINLTDNTAIENAITTNNSSYGLPLENKYYADYKEEVLTAMQNKNFENIMDLQKYFADTYVMTAFADALGYETIGVIVSECGEEIGYDADKFEKLDEIDGAKTALYEDLKLNQDDLTTIDAVKDFIDNFEAPEEEEEETSSSDRYYGSYGGGGGGGGGGSSISMPATVITTNTPNADNTVVAKKQLYPDVPVEHWAYDGIRYLSAVDAVSGYEDSTFKPNNQITRSEFVKILMVAFEIEIPTIGEEDELPFADIAATDWFTPYFVAANNAGVVLGDGGNANPDVLISRQEIAVMIDRVVKMQDKVLPKTNGLVRFDDDADIADWAYGAISKMQIADIINGDGSGNFLPKANATRAESAKMIYGAVQKAYVEPEPVEEEAQEETVNE